MLAYCLDCTTAFAVDLQFCPNCSSRRKSYTQPELLQVEDIIAGLLVPEPPPAPAKPVTKKATAAKDTRVAPEEGDRNV